MLPIPFLQVYIHVDDCWEKDTICSVCTLFSGSPNYTMMVVTDLKNTAGNGQVLLCASKGIKNYIYFYYMS